MSPETQHKLRSFIRNGFFSSVVKHGGSSKEATRKTAEAVQTTSVGAETNRTSLHQDDDRRAIGPDLPKPVLPPSPPVHPRVNLPRLSPEQANMTSHRQIKKGKERVAGDDRHSHAHPIRRHSHGLSINDTSDTDKNKLSAEQLTSSDSTNPAELERLKKEIELLKKTIHEQRKIIKKQSKRNEELKNEVAVGIASLTEKDAELTMKEDEMRKMKDNFSKTESSMSSFETMFQCQVCIELLQRPYAISPCGHVFCLLCLQEWFRKAPAVDFDDDEDLDSPRYILRRPKSCPCCRTKIVQRPIPLFVVRAATNALVMSRAQLNGTECPPEAPTDDDGDPWKGIFPTDDDDEFSTDEESSSESGGADSLAESDDRLSVHFTHYTDEYPDLGFESEASEYLSDEPYGDDNPVHSSDEDDIYVRPRWQPASRFAGFQNGLGDNENNSQTISLLRRGCPLQMILSFHMTYSREDGIIAHVSSFNPGLFLNDMGTDTDVMSRVLLGWNIEVDEEMDKYGCMFMQRTLLDLEQFPQRWDINLRLGATSTRAYDAIRLVKLSEVEDYDSDLASYLEEQNWNG
ncbi:hypothetical protein APHAL10511_002250 [Amanita phalloides]|nr:hypothetical protein APHAL10511_002250 [Amanita phalloides]